jgi:hypothetical protein
LYTSQNISGVIKLKTMRRARQVSRKGRWEMRTKFWSENLKGRDHSEDLGVDGRILLNGS